VSQTHTEVRANQTHKIDGLNPDTNYTVSVVVVNLAGLGHAANYSTLTLEEGKYTYLVLSLKVRSFFDKINHGIENNLIIA